MRKYTPQRLRGHNERLANDYPNGKYWWTEQSRIKRDAGLPLTMAGHIVVLFTNSRTPVGRARIMEDVDSTLGPKECQVPEGHPGGSI